MAELALAIVPLCLAAIELSGVAGKRFKLAQHHDREMKRLRRRFEIQSITFLDECQLLLQELVDNKDAEEMISHVDHAMWQSAELHEAIESHMGRRHSEFVTTVTDIQTNLQSLNDMLKDRIGEKGGNVNDNKLLSIRQAFSLMLRKSDYEIVLQDLTDSIEEFIRLRTTASRLTTRIETVNRVPQRSIPGSYSVITCYSKSFHETLQSVWSCLQMQHERHEARLFLEPKHDSTLHVTISYYLQLKASQLQHGTSEFLVRSQNVRADNVNLREIPIVEYSNYRKRHRPRKVRFSDEDPNDRAEGVSPSRQSTVKRNKLSLEVRPGGDLCTKLCQQAAKQLNATSSHLPHCLESHDSLQHWLSPLNEGSWDPKTRGDPVTLASTLRQSSHSGDVSVPERIQLALSLVQIVLRFHATPWLWPYWSLEDLSHFEKPGDFSQALRTLHVISALSSASPPSSDRATSPVATMPATSDDAGFLARTGPEGSEDDTARLRFGVRNPTMYSLGVALLQIGRWAPLDLKDLERVRRLGQAKNSPLGQNYQRLTQMCLECDFGFGSDLAEPKLLGAVYGSVACELESLIRTLEGGGGDRGRVGVEGEVHRGTTVTYQY